MKLNPEQDGKGREVERHGRRSSFARARTQLSQAVGEVLTGRSEGRRQSGWLNAFGALSASPPPSSAERLREVVIRDRALAAANPRPRRTLREEEEAAAAIAAAALRASQLETPAEATDARDEAALEGEATGARTIEPTASHALDDDAVHALAAALDEAARDERTPDELAADASEPAQASGSAPSDAAVAQTVEQTVAISEAPAAEVGAVPGADDAEERDAAPAARAEADADAASSEVEVAAAPAVSAPTPLEEIAAKATKVKSKAGGREGGAKPKREPIRTRTMARLLASQGHRTRALSIYDELIAADASDASLRDEAEALRRQAD